MGTEQKQSRLMWFLLANKPEWCRPIDIALIVIIIARTDDEGRCYASQETLSKLARVSKVETLRLSLDRLIEGGWLIQESRKGSQQSNILMPQYHVIPKDGDPERVICWEIRQLTGRYYETVKALPKVLTKNNRYRMAARPHKSWPQHWGLVMQKWMDDGATVEQIQAVVDYAFQHHGHIAKRGAQCIKPYFKQWLAEVNQ